MVAANPIQLNENDANSFVVALNTPSDQCIQSIDCAYPRGTCQLDSASSSMRCVCQQGWAGYNCSIPDCPGMFAFGQSSATFECLMLFIQALQIVPATENAMVTIPCLYVNVIKAG